MLRLPAAERDGFRAGFRIISPLLPAIFSWGLVTGVAMGKSILTVPQAIGMSLMLYAGSAQLASLPLFAAGMPLWTILLTVGIVNLRFVIFSAALQPHFSYLSLPRRIVLGYVNGDLGFVMFMNQKFASGYVPGKEGTYYGITLSNWAVWHVSSILGILLGAPTLRLRGDYLAIVTLGFGEIIRIFVNNLDRPVNITNGPKGITGIEPASFAGFDFSKVHNFFGIQVASVYMYYYLFVFLALLIAFVCVRLQHSRIGRAWVAIREDEVAAKAMGINTRNIKLLAFAMGASFGGVAGGMFSAFQGFVSPESFTFWESIIVLSMVVLGGMGHIPGVILGGILLSAFPEVLRSTMGPLQTSLFGSVIVDPEVIRQLLYGLAMILIMLYRPAGLWPSPRPEERTL